MDAAHAELFSYQDTLKQFLCIACSLSDRVAIVTNSKRPWVDRCIHRYLPGLTSFMEEHQKSGQIEIVYADEAPAKRTGRNTCLRPVHKVLDNIEDKGEMLTAAKYNAMKREATKFYSRYSGQTWKNILSFGDMEYEHDAVQEVSWRRKGPKRECLRTKAVVLPEDPTLTQLTLSLQLLQILLPAYVNLDGDIDANFKEAEDPWKELADGLQIPEMAQIPFPQHVWGRAQEPSQAEATEALDQVAILLHEKLF